MGVMTNRDRWCINPSRQALKNNIKTLLGTYHSELARYEEALACGEQMTSVMNFVTKDNHKIKWTPDLLRYFKNKQVLAFDENAVRIVHYRPFAKRYLYFAKELNWSRYRLPLLFPDPQYSNILLGVSGIGSRAGFSCFMVDQIPDLDLIPKARWFPLYYYTKAGEKKDGVNAETRQYFSYSEKAVSSIETLCQVEEWHGFFVALVRSSVATPYLRGQMCKISPVRLFLTLTSPLLRHTRVF